MKQQEPLITVGRLMDELAKHDREMKLSFNGLDFYRLIPRSDTIVQFEFNQQVDRFDDGEIVVS
jgi:hypothetical protein